MESYYLLSHQLAVRFGKVSSAMIAYSAVNGVPDNCNSLLLQEILKGDWNFTGVAFSDNGGVEMIKTDQNYTKDFVTAAAYALNAGLDQDMGSGGPGPNNTWDWGGTLFHKYLPEALEKGLIKESQMDDALRRILRIRIQLGYEDPDYLVPFNDIPKTVVGSAEHAQLNLQTSLESLTLLKNKNSALPLNKKAMHRVAMIGPNANATGVLFGGQYSAFSATPSVNMLQGLQTHLGTDVDVLYHEVCDKAKCQNLSMWDSLQKMLHGQKLDALIFVGGLDAASIEVENGDRGSEKHDFLDGFNCEDEKIDVISLPGCQSVFLQRIRNMEELKNVPIILVLLHGGPVSMQKSVLELSDAIISAFYPGPYGGAAVSQLIFGDYNPAGRLPYTVFEGVHQVPDFNSYKLTGRTYRYLSEDTIPQFRFGDGLSFSSFEFSNLTANKISLKACGSLEFSVSVLNKGPLAGDSVVQVYLEKKDRRTMGSLEPRWSLQDFHRQTLAAKESFIYNGELLPFQLSTVSIDPKATRKIVPGKYTLHVGGHQPGIPGSGMTNFDSNVISLNFDISGAPTNVMKCMNQRLRPKKSLWH